MLQIFPEVRAHVVNGLLLDISVNLLFSKHRSIEKYWNGHHRLNDKEIDIVLISSEFGFRRFYSLVPTLLQNINQQENLNVM